MSIKERARLTISHSITALLVLAVIITATFTGFDDRLAEIWPAFKPVADSSWWQLFSFFSFVILVTTFAFGQLRRALKI